MDIWDLKPGQATGGPFKQISTSVDGIAISEHMPMTAKTDASSLQLFVR